MGFDRKSF